MPAPRIGQIVDDYRYLGGDPNAPGSWGPAAMADSPVDQKSLADARDQSAKSLNTAMQAGRFMAMNAKQQTGMGSSIAAMFGNDKLQSMDAITSRVAPGLRATGSGSSSDKDVSMYIHGFPNINTKGTANEETTKGWHDQAVLDAAKSAYLDSWYQHKGTLLGAEPAFQGYWAKRSGQAAPRSAPASDISKLSDDELKAKLGL